MATKVKTEEKKGKDAPFFLLILGIGVSGALYFLLKKKPGGGGIKATLAGILDDDGGAPTKVSFEYSKDEELVTESTRIEATAGTEFYLPLADLYPGATYYFRSRAENEAGIVFGETLSFQT